LLVLGRVPESGNDSAGPPRIAVTLALVLTLASLGMLIAFIHHVARSIQASHVVLRAHQELQRSIETVYPESLGRGATESSSASEPDDAAEADAHLIDAARAGYLQAIATDDVMAFAREHDAVVHLLVRPGQFVTTGDR